MTNQKNKSSAVCSYCSGTGYLQLLLGGSETCQGCEGTGVEKHMNVMMEAKAPLEKIFHMVLNSRC